MTSYAVSCYPIAVQSVKDAIAKDGMGETKEAYCTYLSSLLFMAQALKDEAWDRQELKDVCVEETFRLFKLAEQCLERAHDMLKHQRSDRTALNPGAVGDSPLVAQRRHSQPPSSNTIPLIQLNRPTSNAGSYNTNQASSLQSLNSLLASPPGVKTSPSSKTFHSNNQDMFQAYQRRKSYRSGNIHQKYASANFNLSLFRKEAEKQALAKARERAVSFLRFISIYRRWNNRQNRSSRDKDYRQNLLANILAYEEDAKWPKTFRDTLHTKKGDIAVIVNIVQAVLVCKDHPLAKYLNEIHCGAYQKIMKLLKEDASAVEENIEKNTCLTPVDAVKRYTPRPQKPPPPKNLKNTADASDKISVDPFDNQTLNPPYSKSPLTSVVNQPLIFNKSASSSSTTDLSTSNMNYTEQTESHITKVVDNSEGTVVCDENSSELKENYKKNKSTSLEKTFDEMVDEMFSSESENEDENVLKIPDDILPQVDIAESEPSYQMVDGSLERKEALEIKKTLANNNADKNIQMHERNKEKDESRNYTGLMTVEEENMYEGLSEHEDSMYEGLSVTTETSDGTKDIEKYESLNSKESLSVEIPNDTKHADQNEPLGSKNDADNIYEEIEEIQKRTRIDSKRITRKMSPDVLLLVNTGFLKHLDDVVQDLLFGIDRLHSVLLLTYEELDTPTGRDQSYATLETIFFKPLWPWIIKMFRKLNAHKESILANVMRKYKSCEPNEMKVREQFSLLDSESVSQQHPYKSAIEELKQLPNFTCPLEKLECCVRMSKAICHCVETYWLAKGQAKPPSLGCDDLLPLVSYVVLKTRSPQIVSECHAMEEFIHEGYLMGEEGYCLTTLHAAISYLLTLHESE